VAGDLELFWGGINTILMASYPMWQRAALCGRCDFDFVAVKMGMFTLGLPLIQCKSIMLNFFERDQSFTFSFGHTRVHVQLRS